MSVSRRFLLDANVFIEAHQKHYGFAICPGFWQALVRQHEHRRVFSIDRVRAELVGFEDALSDWARETAPSTFFKGTADRNVFDAFREMVNWVQSGSQFTPEAKAEFASVADGWIVAYARANDLVVVTHEAYAPDVRRSVPIPNVCIEFDVEYCNTFEMLKELRVQFVLRSRKSRK